MSGHLATETIAEAVDPPERSRVIARLRDWQNRVHSLYDAIVALLGSDYLYDRSRKHISDEEIVQKVGLAHEEVPPVDILHILRHGELVAELHPKGLWIIGANGRVDLLVLSKTRGRRFLCQSTIPCH